MKSKTVRFQDDMGTNGSKVLVVFYVYYYFFCFEDGGGPLIRRRSTKSFKGEFQIGDIVDYVHDGLEVSVHTRVCVCVCVCVCETCDTVQDDFWRGSNKFGNL